MQGQSPKNKQGNQKKQGTLRSFLLVIFYPETFLNFSGYLNGCSFFAYNWKLPAYSGAFCLQLTIISFLLTVGALLLTVLAFSLTVGAFLLTVGKRF